MSLDLVRAQANQSEGGEVSHYSNTCTDPNCPCKFIDTSEIRKRFTDETRQKFADAGYDLSIVEVDILVTKLPCSLYDSLFGRLLQPMHGAEARPAPRTNEIYIDQAKQITTLEAELATEREHPTSVLQCAACQRLAVVQNVQLAARAELAEGDLAAMRARRCEGCGHADKNGDPWGCRANMLLFPRPTECCNHWLEARV